MQLVNAFDLVRLHLYGDKDDSAPGNTPVSKLPSYKAMCEMAMQDSAVQAIYNKEQFAQLQADFGAIAPIPGNGPQQTPGDSDGAEPVQGEVIGDDGQQADPNAWLGYIQRDENGKIKQTIDNVLLILNNDPRLCGRFMLNEFSGRGEVLYPLPWDKDPDKFKRRAWADSDISAMYWYMEKGYKITKRNAIDAGLDIHAATHAFNEVQNFIKGLAWDGVPRLDTLFIDYLGADDSPYTRAVTRKAFVGAVARAMEPGCKFDNMLILCGPQGLGKSTLLDRMSKGWYNDSIRTFEGKEASELLQGVWLVEVAELDAFRKTDVSRIKQFLSLRYDRYRAAYGRNVKELPRCCVFFGTCNVSDFLQDTTGNRRFWPVDVGQGELIHRAWDLTDDEINQIWAEAKMRWMMGEPLFLTGDLADAARARQEDHREASVREGLIRDFVERDVPTNWLEWPLDKRRDYWAGACKGQDIPTMPRDRICAAEVWCELFNGAPRDIKQADTREINAVLASTPGWDANRGMKFGPYKQQRGYRRFNRQA
jgi:predicted P-loop ATPase